ncbi:uncharacterized protein PGTG_08022 [Puccinia graminis f. sp. tritici CRL 75-36-700-3]|uniref:Uncharacterized protein n=1 Tax=Puccinia graminis f. sp. tritici (strain CRL 75-36-700-3 / race SCCL) TaxID=418459 RepID=E3KBX1_PUCGT|nr:uncharacterized protein PGTG_08022 [Puccinia graminis f. sp. tritici CRL 75-36-700-3]EFP81773.2 hypothetical protein PGTG_08022 [Puccinia graminis f. sp. tritici CRL 75-36-700-3]
MSNSRAFALDESSAINFKPYDSSNHKAQLVDFIRLVDNHAIIPPKIKVNPLRDLANKYLNILNCSKSSIPHSFSEGSIKQPARCCSITSKNSIYRCCSITSKNSIYSQAISGKISITGKGLCGSITSQNPFKIVQAQCCQGFCLALSQAIYYSPPITRKIYSWPITSQTISTIKIYSWPITSQTQTIKAIKTERKTHISPKTKKISFPVPKTCPFSKSITSTKTANSITDEQETPRDFCKIAAHQIQ